MLNAGITPVVHEYGSLGCSGDLAPLVALRARAHGRGRRCATPTATLRRRGDALARAGIEPVVLAEKEGLALINGTDGMLGMLVLAIADLRHLLKVADVTAAMSVEGAARHRRRLRRRPARAAAAARPGARRPRTSARCWPARRSASHRDPECTRVQDAYSLRCAPQVHGGARDTVEHAARWPARELASAVDNPVVTPDGRVESNGNFHGAPVGLRARLPRDRRGRRRLDGRAPHRPLPRRRPATTACRRSSPTTPASTRAT